jgi:hypothetical protein
MLDLLRFDYQAMAVMIITVSVRARAASVLAEADAALSVERVDLPAVSLASSGACLANRAAV